MWATLLPKARVLPIALTHFITLNDHIQYVTFLLSFFQFELSWIPPFWLVQFEKDVGICQYWSFSMADSNLCKLEKKKEKTWHTVFMLIKQFVRIRPFFVLFLFKKFYSMWFFFVRTKNNNSGKFSPNYRRFSRTPEIWFARKKNTYCNLSQMFQMRRF